MYREIAKNKRNTIFIMVGFIALIMIISSIFAWIFENPSVILITTVIAIIYATIQYLLSTKLAILMTGAKKIERAENRRLYNIVENLTITTGLPMPKIYIINDPAPNAFATGKDPSHAIVATTSGLINIMDDKELTAVVAHELSHVKNYDIRVSATAFALVCVVGFVSDLGLRMMRSSRDSDDDTSPLGIIILILTAILAPIVASIAQMAVSREREYLADMSAIEITRYPEGMISALKKLEEHGRPMVRQNVATDAMFISSPLKRRKSASLFSTHPPIEERIKRLEHAKNSF